MQDTVPSSCYRNYVIDNCVDCWARNLCNSCFVTIAGMNKISFKDKEIFCDGMRKEVYQNLQLYLSIFEQNSESLSVLEN